MYGHDGLLYDHTGEQDSDTYLDAVVEEEDRLEDQDEPVFYDDSEDYYRSLLHGEDI